MRNYTVEFKPAFKEEKTATAVLKSFIKRNFPKSDRIMSMKSEIDDFLRFFFTEKMKKFNNDGQFLYSANFDAHCKWELVLNEMFVALAPFLNNGSNLYINLDDDEYFLVVRDGKAVYEETGEFKEAC